MRQIVAVERYSIFGFRALHPLRQLLRGAVTLLEKENIRRDLRARVVLKGIVRQAYRAQQVSLLRQRLAYLAVFLIHCTLAGDKGHDAARSRLVERFHQEVIMDEKILLVVPLVMDVVAAKRHVADRKIKEVVWVVSMLKPVHGDVGLLIELLGDAPRQTVQLHAVELRVRHGFRQQSEKVADTAGWLQHVSGLEVHLFHGVVDGLDNRGAGVMRVQDRASRRFVFLRRQQLLQLGVLLRPLVVVRVKGLRNAAPSDVARECFLFFRCGKAALRLDLLQGTDSRHVVLIFCFLPARAEVIVGDAEVVALRPNVKGADFNIKGNPFVTDIFDRPLPILWLRERRGNLPAVDLDLLRLCGRRFCLRLRGGFFCFPHVAVVLRRQLFQILVGMVILLNKGTDKRNAFGAEDRIPAFQLHILHFHLVVFVVHAGDFHAPSLDGQL